MKRFWEIRAAKADPKQGEVLLYGPISNTSWWGDEVTPKAFADDLKALGDVETLTVYINSEGGDVFAAQAIYSMLRRHPATVNTYVDGLAASAASLIAMAGETVTMPINAMMMVHSPWALAMGNAADLRAMADDLDKIRESLTAVYVAKTGMSDEEIIAIMDAETWLTASEAVEQGFADVVEGSKQIAASVRDDQLTINGRQVDLTPFANFPRDRLPFEPDPPEPSAEEQVPFAVEDADAQARLRALRLRARL